MGRICAHAFDALLSNLQNLRQIGSLQAYFDTFDVLYLRAI